LNLEQRIHDDYTQDQTIRFHDSSIRTDIY
jgi:hypothetical protein